MVVRAGRRGPSETGEDVDVEAVERRRLAAVMPGASPEVLDEWLAIEPRLWVVRHGPALHAGGLTAADAASLLARLGDPGINVAALIEAGRMGDLDLRYIHLWAAAGFLKPDVVATGRPGRIRKPVYTTWVTRARQYLRACGGDHRLAALSAAAGLSAEEAAQEYGRGGLDPEALEMLAALRDSPSA